MDRRQFLTVAVGTTALVAGCTGGGGGGQQQEDEENGGTQTATPTAGGAQAATTVVMKDTTFQPRTVEVKTGATVKWVNKDSFTHDVTSAQFHDVAASWDIATTLEGGQSTTHTFEKKGVYEYYCTIHGKTTMCGAVLVGGATLEKSLPCAGDGSGGGGY